MSLIILLDSCYVLGLKPSRHVLLIQYDIIQRTNLFAQIAIRLVTLSLKRSKCYQ